MAAIKFRCNFQIRGRLATDPDLVIRQDRRNPNKIYTLCNFSVAKNLNDAGNKVNYFRFVAWDNPDRGSLLASEIVNNFKKGDWITITRSEPSADNSTCQKCHARRPSYNTFTLLEIDGYDMMGLKDEAPDNELQNEITLIMEAVDGVY